VHARLRSRRDVLQNAVDIVLVAIEAFRALGYGRAQRARALTVP